MIPEIQSSDRACNQMYISDPQSNDKLWGTYRRTVGLSDKEAHVMSEKWGKSDLP